MSRRRELAAVSGIARVLREPMIVRRLIYPIRAIRVIRGSSNPFPHPANNPSGESRPRTRVRRPRRVLAFFGKGNMMKRKLIITGLLLLGGLWLAKKTSLCSYASVMWAKVKADVKEQVPTQVELDRVRLEIASMDKDISNMLR